MKFLDVYPSKDALESRHRGITRDIDPDKLIKLGYGRSPFALANLGLPKSSHDAFSLLLQAVPEKYLDQLMSVENYTPGEILIGLRVLFRQGKGENSTYSVEFKNGVILKYGSRKTELFQCTIVPSDEVHNKIACGVKSAREMARRAQEAIAEYCNDYPGSEGEQLLTRDTLSCHFGRGASEEDLPVLRDISRKYGTIARSLDGHIIIADVVDDRSLGIVRHREYESFMEHSPHKTYRSSREDSVTGVKYNTLVGNIHINFNWVETVECNAKRLAWTIVHEASHKFCDTRDHAYGHQTEKYEALTPELRQQNADTYAYAAVSFDAGKVILQPDEIR